MKSANQDIILNLIIFIILYQIHSKPKTFLNKQLFSHCMQMQTMSKFIKVRCPKCKNEQIIFEKASTKVMCLVCEKPLATPSGGKSNIKARALEVLE
jgi:small subunit ribosomal protein S27e